MATVGNIRYDLETALDDADRKLEAIGYAEESPLREWLRGVFTDVREELLRAEVDAEWRAEMVDGDGKAEVRR